MDKKGFTVLGYTVCFNIFQKAGMSFKVDNKMPNLINLNEDPQLCEILVYALKEGSTSVGRQSSTSSSDIQLTGALIAPNHWYALVF